MFSGIVKNTAEVIEITRQSGNAHLVLKFYDRDFLAKLSAGDSLAVDGICLSVSKIKLDTVVFNLLDITVSSTNLIDVAPGYKTNIERSVRADLDFGGAIVRGHIDTVGFFEKYDNRELTLKLLDEEANYFISEGSTITLNGVNLTVRNFADNILTTELIPVTLHFTNLSKLVKKGTRINVEYDFLEKIITKKLMNNLKLIR